MILLTSIIGIFVLWVASTAYALFSNYCIARRTGLPLLITPIDSDNLFWVLVSDFARHYLEPILPTFLHGMKVNVYGWEFREKYRLNHQVGSTFLLVTPGRMEY